MSSDVYVLYGGNGIFQVRHAIVPIENAHGHLGVLIGDNLHKSTLENVLYVRKGKQVHVRTLEKVTLKKADGYVVADAGGRILPMPSTLPYRVLDITDFVNDLLRDEFNKQDEGKTSSGSKNCLEMVMVVLKNVGFQTKKPFLRKRVLVTPEGYADQTIAYSGMNEREDEVYDWRLDRGSWGSGFLGRRR